MPTSLFLPDDELPKKCPEADLAYYRRIRDLIYPRFDVEVKAFLEKQWQVFEPYADKDFRKKLPKEYFSRRWEMHLAYAMLERGLKLVPSKEFKIKNKGAPDFLLEINGQKVWIEAVAPTPGDPSNQDAVRENPIWSVSQPEDWKNIRSLPILTDDDVALRYVQAMSGKRKQYKGYCDSGDIVSKDDVMIVAISSSGIGSTISVKERLDSDVLPILCTVLYRLKRTQTITTNLDSGITTYAYEHKLNISRSSTGAVVEMGLFCPSEDNEYNIISAVLFCNSLMRENNVNYSDFGWFENPNAINKIPRELTTFGHRYFYDENKKCWRREPHPALILP